MALAALVAAAFFAVRVLPVRVLRVRVLPVRAFEDALALAIFEDRLARRDFRALFELAGEGFPGFLPRAVLEGRDPAAAFADSEPRADLDAAPAFAAALDAESFDFGFA